MRDFGIEPDTVIALWRIRVLIITSLGVSEVIHWRTDRLTHINDKYTITPKVLPFDWVEGAEIRRLNVQQGGDDVPHRAHGIRGQHKT